MTELTYYIAISLDGYIADPDGGTDVFTTGDDLLGQLADDWPEAFPGPYRDAMGLADRAPRHVDTVVMGRHTYAPALDAGLTSPYHHLDQYVVSTTLPADVSPDVTVVDRDPVALVRGLKDEDRLGIWLCGGGRLAAALVDEIDELVLKVNPVVLGEGRPLFAGAGGGLGAGGRAGGSFHRRSVRELAGDVTMLTLGR